jgi:hypothetical protein
MRHFHNATHAARRNLTDSVFHKLHFREYSPTAGYTYYSFYGFLALQFLRLGYWYVCRYQSIRKTLATISSRSFAFQFAI